MNIYIVTQNDNLHKMYGFSRYIVMADTEEEAISLVRVDKPETYTFEAEAISLDEPYLLEEVEG